MQAARHSARSPITCAEFINALQIARRHSRHGHFSKMGLAVSGGVDSMAMLYLWHRALKEFPSHVAPSYDIFLVNHNARPGSESEVDSVAQHIKMLTGVQAKILQLDWGSQDPAKLSNFESVARRLRYQALGKACLAQGVSHLMLAHHKGDKLESVIQRIAAKHHGPQLAGMASVAQLPECEGHYGIYESGSPKSHGSESAGNAWRSESGGMKVMRPLLAFSKQQLIDTCIVNGVEWHEDQTNHDPTFTQRNAVRALLKSPTLPRALREERLLELVDRVSIQDDLHSFQRRNFLSACLIESLDLRSGTLKVFLPSLDAAFAKESSPVPRAMAYYICHSALRYLVDLISPQESINSRSFSTAVTSIYPNFAELSPPHPIADFTISGVRVRRLGSSAPHVNTPVAMSTSYPTSHHGVTKKNHVLCEFTRAKPRRDAAPTIVQYPASGSAAPLQRHGEDSTRRGSRQDAQTGSTGFTLWDGRYWLHIQSSVPVTVAPLEPLAFRHLEDACKHGNGQNATTKRHRGEVARLVRAHPYPGAIPAIVLSQRGDRADGAGAIVALPTFDLVHPDYRGVLRWTVHYKKIDLEALNLAADPHRPFCLRHCAGNSSRALQEPQQK